MKKTLIALVSLFLLSGACWSDDLEANVDEAKYYDNAKVVRIKSIEGEGFVRRSYDEGDEEAVANLPLFEKDTIGTTNGRLAVYLGRMNYLRLDGDTVVVLDKVPQLRKTDLVVRLEEGSIYLEIQSLDREKGIEIQTPDCGIFLLDKGVYRVNVLENETTEVIVREGIAEVSGSDSSRNVRDNQKIVMARGTLEERPHYFYASEKDGFDRWNDEQDRELGYARYGTSRYLQGGYEDYEYDMSRSGRWTYMSEYGSYVWSPYHAGSDWMPYANGRWIWNPHYGYVWVSYDTCGWFTHHYGRWHWDYYRGWYWIPSYHWSPAWVSWFWDSHYYGWCPLSWWNRPIVIINNRWDRHYNYHRGIPRHSRSTIIIRKGELAAPNIHRVAIRNVSLDQGGSIAFRGRAPSERPLDTKVTVINARGRSVIYKQGGIVSGEKYRAQGSDIKDSVYRYNQANGVEYRSRATGESGNGRVRSAAGADGSSEKGVYRSRSGGEESSGSSGYRSRSGSSSTSSSSSSSSSSTSGKAKKKKKDGESSSLSYSGNDHSSRSYGSAGNSNPDGAAQAPTQRTSGSTFFARQYRGSESSSGYRSRNSGSSGSNSDFRSRNSGNSGSNSDFRSRNSGSSGSNSDYRSRNSGSSGSNADYRSRGSGGYAPSARMEPPPSRPSGSSAYRPSGSYTSPSRPSATSSHSSNSSRAASSSSSSSQRASSSSSSSSNSGSRAKKK